MKSKFVIALILGFVVNSNANAAKTVSWGSCLSSILNCTSASSGGYGGCVKAGCSASMVPNSTEQERNAFHSCATNVLQKFNGVTPQNRSAVESALNRCTTLSKSIGQINTVEKASNLNIQPASGASAPKKVGRLD